MPAVDQNTSQTNTGSPKDKLTIARAKLDTAQRISTELRRAVEAFNSKIELEVAPDQELPELDLRESSKLASLKIMAASKEKEAIQFERDVVAKERQAGILDNETAEKRLRFLNQRYFSAGDGLWRHQMKKIRFEDPWKARLIDPCGGDFSQGILALYKRDWFDKKKGQFPRKRKLRWCKHINSDSRWRQGALDYYKGSREDQENDITSFSWCHISGTWHIDMHHRAAHIVPFSRNNNDLGELLFSDRAESLQRAGNALLLSVKIKEWFDNHHLVVVPVDATETPITRWRTDIISPSIRESGYTSDSRHRAKDLDGKELVFLNKKRPVPRFLYFHFVMALIRIKDLQRPGWEDIWARYYEQRPFPTPRKYMRESMLLALATHFGSTHMHVVESWIADHSFESPLKLTDDESVEAARRVYMVVDDAAENAEKWRNDCESEDESEESDVDSEEE